MRAAFRLGFYALFSFLVVGLTGCLDATVFLPATCGVPGGTQACVCPDSSTASQSCEFDGSWGACECEDPVVEECPGIIPCNNLGTCVKPEHTAPYCECFDGWGGASCDFKTACYGVQCAKGGTCVVDAGVALCDCPPGSFGPGCVGSIATATLAPLACTTIETPNQWTPRDSAQDGFEECGMAQWFSLDVGTANVPNSVRLAIGQGGSLSRVQEMHDDDGDGVWETYMMLTAGAQWEYLFYVDGDVTYVPGLSKTLTNGGERHVVNLPPCVKKAGGPQCERLFGDASVDVFCDAPQPGCAFGTAECPQGCVDNYWVAIAYDTPKVISSLRFLSDWWSKRPEKWELWASDHPGATPTTGARLIASGFGETAPWQCAEGESCNDPEVPDYCCANGRDKPQAVVDGNWKTAKWEIHPVPYEIGQFFFFRVVSTASAAHLYMGRLMLEGADARSSGGRFGAAECTADFIGPAAGCAGQQWCAPGYGADGVSPGCVAIGTAVAGQDCVDPEVCKTWDSGCPETFHCQAGLACLGESSTTKKCRASCAESGNCVPSGESCQEARVGNVTLPFKVCAPTPCSHPFNTGECGLGSWCAPVSALLGRSEGLCMPYGQQSADKPCGANECGAGDLCIEGSPWTCQGYCDPGHTPSIMNPCTNGKSCVPMAAADLGECRWACDSGKTDTCFSGFECRAGAELGLKFDACHPVFF